MRKGNKADYVTAMKKQLGDDWVETDSLPATDSEVVVIIDCMAFIHHHQDFACHKFFDIQDIYLQKVMSSRPASCTCVNMVGDRYDFDSAKRLKGEGRARRQKDQRSNRTYEIKDNFDIPAWKPFISNSTNKEALQVYVV